MLKRTNRLFIALFLGIFCLCLSKFNNEALATDLSKTVVGTVYEDVYKSEYTNSYGTRFISYSYKWDVEKLKSLNEELLKNKHGEEIQFLKEVKIYSGIKKSARERGHYKGRWGEESDGTRFYESGEISLYSGDNTSNIEDYARILSHEYGHHFTMYYMWIKEGKTFKEYGDWEDTDYYEIRKIEDYPWVTGGYDNGYSWAIHEIAAEDYVQLYGSETIYKYKRYEDISDRNVGDSNDYESKYYNTNPQINLHLPLANEVKGLREYWDSLAGFDKVDEYIFSDIALIWTKKWWDTPDEKLSEFEIKYSEKIKKEDWIYTLMVYNNLDLKHPITTFNKNTTPYGYFGEIKKIISGKETKLKDSHLFTRGLQFFKVVGIHLPTGRAFSSNPVIIDFENERLYTEVQDYNMNGIVDEEDIMKMMEEYGEEDSDYDINYDDIVDLFDIMEASKKMKMYRFEEINN